MRSAQRVVMDANSSVIMDANGAKSPERSAKLKNDLEPIDDVSSTPTESDSVDYELPGSTMSVPESVRNAVRRGRRMTETAIEEAKPLVIDLVYCRSIGGMMIYIAMLGTLNNFSGRIRAETLGESRRAAAGRAELLANPAIRAQILAGSIQTPGGLRTA